MRQLWYRFEEGVIALLLLFMTGLTFYQVVLRYAFNDGITWGQEAVLYAFAWLVLFGLAYGLRTRAHLGIDVAVKLLAVPARRRLGLVAIACCALYAGLLFYGAFVYIEKLYSVGIEAQDLPVERWLLGAVMPFGFLMILVRLVAEARLILTRRADGFDLADEAGDALAQHYEPTPGTSLRPANEG